MVLKKRKTDKRFERTLKNKGWTILRFWEHEINKDVKKCVDKIELHLKIWREKR